MATTLKQANKMFMIREYSKHLENCRQTAKFLNNEIKRLERQNVDDSESLHDEATIFFNTYIPEYNDV